MLARALERLLHQRLAGNAIGARAVDQRDDGVARVRIEPRVETRVLRERRRRKEHTREKEHAGRMAAHRAPGSATTVSAEFGSPKSSPVACGAAGSGRHTVPSTTNAYRCRPGGTGTSTDHTPPVDAARSGVALGSQLLKSPTSATLEACGATKPNSTSGDLAPSCA